MSRRPAFKTRLTALQSPFWVDVARWLVKLPRYTRLAIVLLFSLAVTFAVSPLVDYWYLSYIYTPETRILPSLISSGAGITMFFFGWWLLVGTSGEVPAIRRGVIWYLVLGIAAVTIVVALAVFGLSTATAPF
jgi:hypothetical protein